MKRFIYLALLMFIPLPALCINSKADKPIVKSRVQQKVDSINDAGIQIYLKNPRHAREIGQQALLIAKKESYDKGIAQSFLLIGKTYWAQSYYPIALFYYKTAVNYLQTNDQILLSDCHSAMGRTYLDIKKYDIGINMLTLAIKEAGTDTITRELAYAERSYGYQRTKQYNKAIADINMALKLSYQLQNTSMAAIMYARLAAVYDALNNNQLRIKYTDTAYKLSLVNHNRRLQSTLYISRAVMAFENKDYDTSLKNAFAAHRLADSIGVAEIAATAIKLVSKAYEAKGDKNQALLYARQLVQLRDSVNAGDKANSVQLIQDYFSLSDKLNDIDQIQEHEKVNKVLIRSQKTTIISLSLFVAALIISLYVLYRFYQQKKALSAQLEARHTEVSNKNKLIETQSDNLDRLNRLKDRLLAIIGHDLRSPIANLRNIVDLFEQEYISADEVRQLMQDMSPAVSGAELTLNNLIEWAGSQLKGNDISKSPISLVTLAREMAQVFKYPLSQKQLDLEIDINSDDYIFADENHVKMILRNLLSNAIKFTPEKGKISIRAGRTGNHINISVKDTGKGLSAEETQKLFSADTHFSQTGTQGEKGTGIGLLLCKQLVELNGGVIGINSVLGTGSMFYFTMPAMAISESISPVKSTNYAP